MADNKKESQPRKWTDQEIAKAIMKIEREEGRIIPHLLRKKAEGAYDALKRRVKRGEFNKIGEAIEEIKKKFLPWLLNLDETDLDKVAGWITDTALAVFQGNPEATERLERLNMLIERESKRVKEVRKKIKGQPKANWIVSEFEETKEGENLRSLRE